MNWFVLVAAFLGAAVEFIEALTIVVAVGVTRNWKSALYGSLAAAATLAVIVGIFGYAIIHYVPLNTLKIIIGIFLLLFGLKWLRNAILRFAGIKGLHDEEAIFQKQVAKAKAAGQVKGDVFDSTAFATSYSGVFLEGLEAAFIVITFGSAYQAMPSAIVGAGAALLIVLAIGVILRAPMTKIPENVMKYVVGIMLTTFGTLWAGEGLGVKWPGSDISISWLLGGFLLLTWVLVRYLKSQNSRIMAQKSAGLAS